MTSGGTNFNYFYENQLAKFSAILQFKHSEKIKSCFVGLLCCFVGQRLHIEGNLLTEMEVEVPKKNRRNSYN